MHSIHLLLAAVVCGFALPIQGAMSSKLAQSLDHPMQSTLISYLGGLLACCLILLFLSPPLPTLKKIAEIDSYLYLGGILGTIFVTSMLVLMPRIGVANMLAAALVGQLIMSALLDHLGSFGNPIIKLSPSRIFGIALLFFGLYFVQRGRT